MSRVRRNSRVLASATVATVAVSMAVMSISVPAGAARISRWHSLGGTFASGPAVTSWGPGREDLFARGVKGNLWHRVDTPTGWHAWQNLAGKLSSDPAAATYGPGELDVFARGSDGKIWHKWLPAVQGGAAHWSGWERTNGPNGKPILGSPAAVVAQYMPYGPISLGTPRLVLFARGKDGHLWCRIQQGDWLPYGPWRRLKPVIYSDPEAAVWHWTGTGYGEQIDVFARSARHAIQRIRFNWTQAGALVRASQTALGGSWPSSPGAATYFVGGNQDEDVFVRGSHGHVYWKGWHPYHGLHWTQWRSLGNRTTGNPAAAYPGGVAQTSDHRPGVDVFARGPQRHIWYVNVFNN